MQRSIKNEADLSLFIRYLKSRKKPFTVDVQDGRKRSLDQNRLAFLWIKEAAEQLGDRTIEELRAEMKLVYGVPILRRDEPKFKAVYDKHIRRLPYPEKLEMMRVMDWPVSRLMSVSQLTEYLDAISRHFLERGVALTDPLPREAA